jgi:hypothetical protein
MVAATITPRALGGQLIKAVRFRLYLVDLLVAEKIEEGGPAAWPETTERLIGPDFYDPGDAFHQSKGLSVEDIRVGRMP